MYVWSICLSHVQARAVFPANGNGALGKPLNSRQSKPYKIPPPPFPLLWIPRSNIQTLQSTHFQFPSPNRIHILRTTQKQQQQPDPNSQQVGSRESRQRHQQGQPRCSFHRLQLHRVVSPRNQLKLQSRTAEAKDWNSTTFESMLKGTTLLESLPLPVQSPEKSASDKTSARTLADKPAPAGTRRIDHFVTKAANIQVL